MRAAAVFAASVVVSMRRFVEVLLLKATRIIIVLALVLGSARCANAGDSIVLYAQPTFSHTFAGDVTPISVQLENFGRSVRGTVDVTSADSNGTDRTYSYPVDLPSGSVKQLTTYPVSNGYSPIRIEYNCPVHVKGEEVDPDGSDGGNETSAWVGFVGDDSGSLAAARLAGQEATTAYNQLNSPSSSQPTSYLDCYTKPESAPDRSIGYSELAVLILGEGSDRLNGDQWAAIHEWVVGGGSLILLGGAGSLTYLEGEGGALLCPLTDIHQITLSSVRLAIFKRSPVYTNVSAVTGLLKPGAFCQLRQPGANLVVTKKLGAGMVTLVTFNPTVQPISGNEGNATLLTWLFSDATSSLSESTIGAWYTKQFTGTESDESVAKNPFLIKLPPFNVIALIFVVYFVIAIPITYFVLRRLGRLDVAWFSTPIIAIIFAFIFYLFTSELYKAGLTHRTAGVLTATQGERDACFSGFSEVFIPHGGTYDISVPNAENLDESSTSSDDDPSGGIRQPLTTRDTITGVTAIGYSVGNLAFRRFYYTQAVDLGGAITTDITVTNGKVTGRVTNNTTVLLNGATLVMGRRGLSCVLGNISPGQTIDLGASPHRLVSGAGVQTSEVLPQILPNLVKSGPDSGYVLAQVPASNFGLLMGEDVSGQSSATFLMDVTVNSKTTWEY